MPGLVRTCTNAESRPTTGRPPADRDHQPAHLPARPAGHRRRGRAQRLRGRGGQAAGQPRHRGGDLHPRGLPRHARRGRAGAGRAGPQRGGRARSRNSTRTSLPGQICPFTFGVLRTEADFAPGRYDLVHAHYWLSGQVAAVAAERWGVPLIQSMHTLGKVKNLALASGDCAEPAARIRGEGEVVAAADRLVANTAEEARQLVELYGASPWRVETVSPGVDLSVFRPWSGCRRRARAAGAARRRGGAGLRGPDPAAEGPRRRAARRGRAAALLPRARGPAGGGVRRRAERVRGRRAGPARRPRGRRWASPARVRLEPPCPQRELADWYRAATVVLVPSHSESFGLVALEAQACGTPVVAAAVGGLRTAVRDGFSGVLVDGHDPVVWARVLSGAGRFARAARRTVPRRAGARVRVRLARHRGPADRRVYRCHGRHPRDAGDAETVRA